ncbi:hypothetical protein GOBAR_AA28502 [Gossypium barbadense]|uniref:Uncharacterized protein n=1 Tax=Gossypium barbadense TaxID=3634 RepID=A0A2P5WM64_GOSBA|nr:hypothetical protein GOBAR_AA28502 [Gossypium barbadense]
MADYSVHRRSMPPPLHQFEATRTAGTGACWRVYGSHAGVRRLGVVAGGVVRRWLTWWPGLGYLVKAAA